MTWLLLVAGLTTLLASGALLVDGASNIALRFRVPPAVIGLTLVAFGTSLPELAVNISATRAGSAELSLGNIFGSNIANIGLVLGATVAVRGFRVESQVMRREVPLLLLITAIALVVALDGVLRGVAPQVDRGDAVVFLLLFLMFIYINLTDILAGRSEDPLFEQASGRAPTEVQTRHLFYVLVGIPGLWLGGDLAVDNAEKIALGFGISEAVVGLTVLAIGTSLPELVTSITAALRGESDLALGNVIGSNLVNTLLILPISAMIMPLPIGPGPLIDIWTCLLFTVIMGVFAFSASQRFSRVEGWLLVLGYGFYISWRYSAF
ncbi:MAG: calcium/sodium antiporter [Halieaceae bacterium]|nr:calcium/sodium antiporter [Halieaceae bacterium]